MDVQSAYLNGELEEEIYMKQPEGFVEKGMEELVCKLHKALYGLKQAGRTWYNKLHECLCRMGYTRSESDYSIYYRQLYDTKVIIAIYVDDIILMSNNLTHLQDLKRSLRDAFTMKDLGEISSYLGIGIKRDRKNRCLTLNQTKYIEDILKKYGIENCRPLSTPIDVNSKLTKDMCPEIQEDIDEMKDIPYQSAVGSLMYLMLGTRPDLAYPVKVVSQFNSNPGKQHWQAVK